MLPYQGPISFVWPVFSIPFVSFSLFWIVWLAFVESILHLAEIHVVPNALLCSEKWKKNIVITPSSYIRAEKNDQNKKKMSAAIHT